MSLAPDPTYANPVLGWTNVNGTGTSNGVVTGASRPGAQVFVPAGSLTATQSQSLGWVAVPENIARTPAIPGLAVPALTTPGSLP